mmetsp:Transcript_90588/g.290388  ORF Transcript_90588/g.290388 Transcript_90588/m.290388 type:complete len:228 (+) Transcript_90588:100-783(+)
MLVVAASSARAAARRILPTFPAAVPFAGRLGGSTGDGAPVAPCPGGWLPVGARGIAKYKRVGIWARGSDGLYTMSDPRIFKPGMRRKYPYHKQRQWSKPYMCTEYMPAAPVGVAVKLAISYLGFANAAQYYKLRRLLQDALPGAQILGHADVDLSTKDDEQAELLVMRLNDGRVLKRFHRGQDVDSLELEELEGLVGNALDNFRWRYGSDAVAADEGRRASATVAAE